MSAKLLAAHLAAIAACATAVASGVGAVDPARNSAPVCSRIVAEDPLERPADLVCVSPRAQYGGISATIDEAVILDIPLDPAPPAPAQATREETRKLDLYFFTGCGLLFLSLGGLQVNAGRKRHRPGARKSVLRLRMMA